MGSSGSSPFFINFFCSPSTIRLQLSWPMFLIPVQLTWVPEIHVILQELWRVPSRRYEITNADDYLYSCYYMMFYLERRSLYVFNFVGRIDFLAPGNYIVT